MKPLPSGLNHITDIVIDEHLTVPQVSVALSAFADMPPVFATAYMVGFIEATCIEALIPFLDDDEATVGTHVDVSHIAATPVGMRVTANVELVEAEGRRLRFKVVCRDEAEVICEGFHERSVINRGRFMTRVDAKATRSGND